MYVYTPYIYPFYYPLITPYNPPLSPCTCKRTLTRTYVCAEECVRWNRLVPNLLHPTRVCVCVPLSLSL